MRKIQMVALAAIAAFGAFAEEEDGHTVLYYNASGKGWNSANWTATSAGTVKVAWQADSVAVIDGGTINFPSSSSSVYRIRWKGGTNFQAANSATLSLGAGGLVLSKNLECVNWKSTNKLHLSASQTWTSANSTQRTLFMNRSANRPSSDPIVLTAADDVELTLSGAFTWAFNVQTAFTNADVKVVSPAVLAVTQYSDRPSYTKFNARTLTLDGSASTLVSQSGDASFMAKTLKLRNGGELMVNSDLDVGVPIDGIAEKIVADNGMGTLAGVVAATESGDAFPVEVAAGATLVLSCKWVGSPRIRVCGAGTVRLNCPGAIPVIERDEEFTGTVELAAETIEVTNPASFNVSDWTNRNHECQYVVTADAKFTLRYFSPRAPVVYTNGLDLMTGVMDESMTNGWSFAYWDSNDEVAYRTQGVFLSLSGDTLKVRPLDPPHSLVGSTTSGSFNWGNKIWKDSVSGTLGYWIDGSVATLQQGLNTTLSAAITTAGGLVWGDFSSYFSGPEKRFHIGKEGITINRMDSQAMGFRAWKMKEFRLVAPQTWQNTTSTRARVYLGDKDEKYIGNYPSLLTADTDASLTLAGSFYTCLNCPTDFHESDVTLSGESAAGATVLYIDYSKWGDRDVMLNARTLKISGRSAVYARQATRVDGGYAIAKKVVFVPRDGYTPTLNFDTTTAEGTYPFIDVGSIETSGEGVGAISSGDKVQVRIPEWQIPVTIAGGTALRVGSEFSNASSRPGAFVLSGEGTWLATSASTSAYTFDNASVAGFEGDVVVTNGAVLNLSGSVDFPSLVLRDGAKVRFKLDRGDKIADMSKVTFPESGSVTFELYRDDGIAQGEGSLDLGMDFSSVSSADLAKIALVVEDRQTGSPYSVTATSRIGESGHLFADLSSTMSKKSSYGGMVWVGRDWADATDPLNWVVYPIGTTAANYNPDNHPADVEAARSKVSASSIYCAANWRIDLGGLEWSSPDSRNNDASGSALVYAVSNGTWNASTMIFADGTILVENGAVFKANGYASGADDWNLGTKSDKASPFLFNVRAGGRADIGHQTRTIATALFNTRYQVDAGGALAYYLKPSFSNGKCTTFANEGELSFPYGLALVNESQATTGELAIVQSAGTLRFAGAFSLTRGEGCGSKAGVTFAGGTTVISNDTTFAGWDFAVADGADFAIEIPKSGDFSTEAFRWGEGVTFEKKGDGVARFALTGEVASVGLRLSGGALQPTGTNDAGRVDVVFAGGAVGVSPTAAGDAAEYGLLVTNGTVSGACSVRDLGGCARSGDAFPFLTVAAEADPAYVSGDVLFVDRKGRPTGGDLLREEIMVGETQCVRYSATFVPRGLMLLVK